MGKRLLSILGLLIAIVGIVFGGNLVLVIIGCVILGLGQMIKDKEDNELNMNVVHEFFEDVKMNPESHILNVSDTNIPLPKHDYCSGSGYVQGKYKGLDVGFCTIKLTDVTEVLRDETGLWEKNENTVYTGEWMLCKLDQKFNTWLTIYPRSLLDKQTIKTGNEAFDKKFNVTCGDEKLALEILNANRLERIMALSNHKFSINLNEDGRLYIAAHSFKNMNDLKWFVDMIDVFRA
ncbi:DUF3137 domain-containing protein [uncultured Holdemanella sp.]|uniref:DUF3137 domain-containing protein n=1 Tax=uncultured Holdemanella sp. TaxID=1763549 RepID=UPI001314C994|nr:DUF3137 domain-containing protein [uncultured Holdemanella sp.]